MEPIIEVFIGRKERLTRSQIEERIVQNYLRCEEIDIFGRQPESDGDRMIFFRGEDGITRAEYAEWRYLKNEMRLLMGAIIISEMYEGKAIMGIDTLITLSLYALITSSPGNSDEDEATTKAKFKSRMKLLGMTRPTTISDLFGDEKSDMPANKP